MIIDGLAIVGTARDGLTNGTVSGNFTLNSALETSPGGSFTAGSIAFCFSYAENDSATPAQVIPAGWTHHLAIGTTSATGRPARYDFFSKLLTSGDIGGTFTTAFGGSTTGRSRAEILQLKFNRPIQSLTNTYLTHTNSTGAPGNIATGALPGGHSLFIGMVCGHNVISTGSLTWSPSVGAGSSYFTSLTPVGPYTSDIWSDDSATRSAYNFYNGGLGAANVTLGAPDSGDMTCTCVSSWRLT